jgi:hypothetical protein
VNSLDPVTLAAYMLHLQPGAAGVEHYREFFGFINFDMHDATTIPVSGPRNKNEQLGGTPVTMTLTMLGGIIEVDSPFWDIARSDPDAMEYEVAATMLEMLTFSEPIITRVIAGGWLRVPLTQWIALLKPTLEVMRRSGMLGDLKSDLVYETRKLGSVTERRDKEADWEGEKFQRRSRAHIKHCVSNLNYGQELSTLLQKRVEHYIFKLASRSDSGDMAWWWKRRHHHVPGGASSTAALARKALRSDARMGSGDRTNKKTTMEMLPTDFYQKLLQYPPANVARASTKKEPGGKYRALYASNDIPYMIAAYASVHTEKVMDKGVCARQGIEDWMTWLQNTSREGYQLSTDYSDYNSEHQLQELELLSLHRARAWLRTSAPYKEEKAACELWLAESYKNTWVEFGKNSENEMDRVISGLFSGHRNTMRDHCDKHYADVRIAIRDAQQLGYECTIRRDEDVCLAGDDEHAIFKNLVSAIAYSNVLSMEGHQLNPRKQLAGAHHSEFLQVMSHPGSTLQRPAAAIIMTLASGNWYKPSATWYDSIIQGMSDNWWEAYCRGLPYVAAFHLCCAYLDTAMRVRVEDRWRPLEWWSFRSPDRPHPMWGCVTASPPIVREVPTPRQSWPSHATDDWMDTVKKQLAVLPQRKVARYRQELLQLSHGSAFLQWRQDTLTEKVLANWPRREQRKYTPRTIAMTRGYTQEEMVRWGSLLGLSQKPRDVDELVSRLGVDPALASMSGSFATLAPTLRGRDWAKYSAILPVRVLHPQCAASSWAFRSWASRSSSTVTGLHIDAGVRAIATIIYIYGPNGAGKTTICRRWPDIVDLDSMLAPLSQLRVPYRKSHNAPNAALIILIEALRRLRPNVDSSVVILGNYPCKMVMEACRCLSLQIICGDYLPGWDLCRARLKKRGSEYTDERIDALQARYIPGPVAFANIQEMRDFIERSRFSGENRI